MFGEIKVDPAITPPVLKHAVFKHLEPKIEDFCQGYHVSFDDMTLMMNKSKDLDTEDVQNEHVLFPLCYGGADAKNAKPFIHPTTGLRVGNLKTRIPDGVNLRLSIEEGLYNEIVIHRSKGEGEVRVHPYLVILHLLIFFITQVSVGVKHYSRRCSATVQPPGPEVNKCIYPQAKRHRKGRRRTWKWFVLLSLLFKFMSLT